MCFSQLYKLAITDMHRIPTSQVKITEVEPRGWLSGKSACHMSMRTRVRICRIHLSPKAVVSTCTHHSYSRQETDSSELTGRQANLQWTKDLSQTRWTARPDTWGCPLASTCTSTHAYHTLSRKIKREKKKKAKPLQVWKDKAEGS